jgi:hypothetical protein
MSGSLAVHRSRMIHDQRQRVPHSITAASILRAAVRRAATLAYAPPEPRSRLKRLIARIRSSPSAGVLARRRAPTHKALFRFRSRS